MRPNSSNRKKYLGDTFSNLDKEYLNKKLEDKKQENKSICTNLKCN